MTVLFTCYVKKSKKMNSLATFPGSIVFPLVNGVDATGLTACLNLV